MTRRKPQTHGGKRAGAGRKSIFDTKAVRAFAMDFTPEGQKALRVLVRRTRLSRNGVLGVLAVERAAALTFDAAADPAFPNKAQVVMSIRLPRASAAALVAAHRRTGRSYSDIGEGLVRWHGGDVTFPAPRARARARATTRRPAPPARS